MGDGSAPQGWAEPPLLPHLGSGAPPPTAAGEVTPRGNRDRAWKVGGHGHEERLVSSWAVPCFRGRRQWPSGPALSPPTPPTDLGDRFPRNPKPPWSSHSRCMACWTVGCPPSPPHHGGDMPQGGHPGPASGSYPKQHLFRGDCSRFQNRFSFPTTPSSLSPDYGVRPKHPSPRGPRPLLSPAQQRKREDPDMAEYYFDTRL